MFLLAFTTFLIQSSNAQTRLYYSTLNDSSDFHFSSTVDFVSNDVNCRGDGNCAKMSGTDPACYLQTMAGVIDTTGYADISIVLKLTLISWGSGSVLTVAWKTDASQASSNTLKTYDHDDLIQNSLQNLYYDLGSGSDAENNENFAIYLTTYFSGNGVPYAYIDELQVWARSTTAPSDAPSNAPTTPTFEPTKVPSIVPTNNESYATLTLLCDDAGFSNVSWDGGASWTQTYNTSSWNTVYSFDIFVTDSTIVRFSCDDVHGGAANFIATMTYRNVNYSTTNPLNESMWSVVSSTDGIISPLTYPARHNNVTYTGLADDAEVVWNGQLLNTMVFEFDFRPFHVTSAEPTTEPTAEPTGEIAIEEWLLIEQHKDVADGYFSTSVLSTGLENENDSNANTYCIIGAIKPDDYRFDDGYFELRLIYRYSDGSNDTLVWTQESWITNETIVGANLSRITTDTYTNGAAFHGLGHSTSSYTYLDGSGASDLFWCHAIASVQQWGGGIPAHNLKAAYSSSLYLRSPDGIVLPTPEPSVSPTTSSFIKGDSAMNWTDAEAYCNSLGYHLASIHSAEENAEALGVCSNCWIGAFSIDQTNYGYFNWTDGTPWDYTNWQPGEPNDAGYEEDCIHMYSFGTWNDNRCHYTFYTPLCKVQTSDAPTTEAPSPSPSSDPFAEPSVSPSANPSAEPSVSPTFNPMFDPTISPITSDPTTEPSADPSVSPTTAHPTASEIMVNVSFAGDGTPSSSTPYLSDPFGRFEAAITVIINDGSGVLGDVANCESCFIWQYQIEGQSEWTAFDDEGNDDISVSISKLDDEYTAHLVVQSIRRHHAGYCIDDEEATDHPFKEDSTYHLRLKFVSDTEEYYVSKISEEFSFSTNSLPSIGICGVQNIDRLAPLDEFQLFCSFSENQHNALIDDVLMNTDGFVDDPQELTGIAGAGNVSIVVLAKEGNDTAAVTCYEFTATFQTVQGYIDGQDELDGNQVAEELTTIIDELVNDTSFSKNPDLAVSIHSVVYDMFTSNLVAQNESKQIVDDIIGNILETSSVIFSLNDTSSNISGNAIITELTTVTSITSNQDIVDLESTTTELVHEYLPAIFDAVDLIIESTSEDTSSEAEEQDILYSIGEQSQELISNLEATLVDAVKVSTSSDTMVEIVNSLSESLVNFATLAASTALAQSEIGETFHYQSDTKTVFAVKFKSGEGSLTPQCGSKGQSIMLSNVFMNNEGVFDCAFVASSINNFISTNPQQTAQESIDIITVNLYESDTGHRRRLKDTVEYESDECFPYLLSMKVANDSNFSRPASLDEKEKFPFCTFWSSDSSEWSGEGCFVNDLVNDTVICGCTHLSTFSVSSESIWPNTNVLTGIGWHELTISNLIAYPIVLITSLSLLIIFCILCAINPRSERVHARSILAMEDIIYESFRREKLWRDVLGKELKIISEYIPNHHDLGTGIKAQLKSKEDTISLCALQLKLYKVYLRNERSSGTNLNVRQRLALFFMYICTIMFVNGIFYGLDQSPIQDVVASFIISLGGTAPQLIIKLLFKNAKPRDTSSTKSAKIEQSKADPALVEMAKIKCAREMREKMYNGMYPLPPYVREIAWILLFVVFAAACVAAVIYGLSVELMSQFDLLVSQSANEENANFEVYQSGCWNTSLELRIENALSEQYFNETYAQRLEYNASSYGGSDAASWLLSLGQSLLLSLILWQPMTIYFVTWIKIWMFTWNLEMKFPHKVPALCKKCCCEDPVGSDNDDLPTNPGISSLSRSKSLQDLQSGSPPTHASVASGSYMSSSISEEEVPEISKKSTTRHSQVFSKEDKPTCRLSYLSDARYCIDDTQSGGGESNEVEMESLRTRSAPTNSIRGFNAAELEGGVTKMP